MLALAKSRFGAVLTSSVGVAASSLITALSSARALGADGRGELAAVIAPYLALVAISSGGLPYAVASLSNRVQTGKDKVEATGLSLAVLLGALASSSLLVWAVASNARAQTSYLIVAAALPLAILMAVLLEYERQRGAKRLYNVARLLPAATTAAICVTLGALGVNRVAPYVLALTLPSALAVTMLFAFRRSIFAFSAPAIHRVAAKRIWRRALAAWPSAVTDTVLLRSDQLIMAVAVDPASLGVYAVAATIAEAGGILRLALTAAAYESFVLSTRREVRNRWRLLLLRLLALTIPAYVALGVLMHFAATRLLGPSFEGISSILAILLVAQLALDIHLSSGTVLLARDHAGLFSYSSAAAAVLHIVWLIPGVVLFGSHGAAMASLVGYAGAALVTSIMVSRTVGSKVRG